MYVHTVTVSFERSRQPRDYETARAQVSYTASLDEGEDHEKATATLIDGARGVVYERLGLKVPASTETQTTEKPKADTEEKPAKKAAPKKSPKAKKAEEKPAEPEEDKSEASGDDKSKASDDETLPGFEDDGAGDSAEDPITDAELQRAASGAAKRVGAEKVKELIREFGVARSAEIPAEKRTAFVDRLDTLE